MFFPHSRSGSSVYSAFSVINVIFGLFVAVSCFKIAHAMCIYLYIMKSVTSFPVVPPKHQSQGEKQKQSF